MLVLARAFGVLNPALTIAACSQSRDPFMRPLAARAEADAARLKLAAGTNSDHIVLVYAFDQWQAARAGGKERDWCNQNFVSWRTMNTVERSRTQLISALMHCGLGGDGDFMWRSSDIKFRLALLRAVITRSDMGW
jgi:HrpA-like RNA helicase